MKLQRRRFLNLAAGAAAFPAASRMARAQTYPSRPVRIIAGFAAGGIVDILARIIGQALSERLGQQFIVENRLGAGSNIATEAVVRASADGHTLLLISVGNAISPALYDNLNFNFIRDIAPVAAIMRVPNVMEVTPSLPVKTVPELIAYAKANPGSISYGSAGIGTSVHVCAELFKQMTGVDMVHVPYRGMPGVLTDLLSGRIQVAFDNVSNSIEHIRAGRLRALAVTTATRWHGLPDTPTVADSVPGFEASAFFGVGAPKDTPAEIVALLNKEINAILASPVARARLTDLGGTMLSGSSADFGTFIADETEKWGKVIRTANIKAE
ncbi:tripartite tricarboxylate transporter substrate binding protein [Bradyrhizobium sp. AUGA SZCCT0222]|uniref:Bug family tripartite tricarboxylate transporter substrate binding protein n=1 Tax=Bradyrhizobium sp. AUGA SZCCT0222 TaxID=2807668 RepID=UPI001BABE1AA|nr:tripartite tricarboxylate transporter substrate binding protein [Bradyrhizobium sp. AUGA SZCCT0222]MBR1266587.1 tripartite tricarboxylate transporter substrate binding protein [Bradyrhizobium sp. AUGA SZCCT0222]